VPIARPLFGPEEAAAVVQPLESGWVVQGPFVQQFEAAFARFTGAPFAAATSSCTTALHLALAALGLRPGDEVIVPAFTWISTANVVEYLGGRPVFCDIDLDTYNLAVPRLDACLTARTVGILPVHLFGLCADMDPVMSLAARHGLWVVEDAACAFGGWYRGRHAGTIGVMGCFSFHPRKSITTGEGGMITTARHDIDALVRSLRDHGASRSDHARHSAPAAYHLAEYAHLGYNFRLTDIQAAVGVAQMDRARYILGERARVARRYDAALAGASWLATPATPDGCVHGYQAYVCLFRPETPSASNIGRLHVRRNALMARLEERGIATRQGTHAAALQLFYREKYGLRPEDFPIAHAADRLTLALPLYPQMTDDDQDYVIEHLLEQGAQA
jgi:dTDP-4-amino-4,6-dideoxygalactose transaminase